MVRRRDLQPHPWSAAVEILRSLDLHPRSPLAFQPAKDPPQALRRRHLLGSQPQLDEDHGAGVHAPLPLGGSPVALASSACIRLVGFRCVAGAPSIRLL